MTLHKHFKNIITVNVFHYCKCFSNTQWKLQWIIAKIKTQKCFTIPNHYPTHFMSKFWSKFYNFAKNSLTIWGRKKKDIRAFFREKERFICSFCNLMINKMHVFVYIYLCWRKICWCIVLGITWHMGVLCLLNSWGINLSCKHYNEYSFWV